MTWNRHDEETHTLRKDIAIDDWLPRDQMAFTLRSQSTNHDSPSQDGQKVKRTILMPKSTTIQPVSDLKFVKVFVYALTLTCLVANFARYRGVVDATRSDDRWRGLIRQELC